MSPTMPAILPRERRTLYAALGEQEMDQPSMVTDLREDLRAVKSLIR